MDERRKRANENMDIVLKHGFEGQELIPHIPNIIKAKAVWPRICKGNHHNQIEEMLKMRLVSKFWCTFVDCTDLMDRQQIDVEI